MKQAKRWAKPRQEPQERRFPLFDPPSNLSRTSQRAARAIRDKAPSQSDRFLALVAARGAEGATNEEAAIGLGIPIQSASARATGLAKAGAIIDSGRERPTATGHSARVWIVPAAIKTPSGAGDRQPQPRESHGHDSAPRSIPPHAEVYEPPISPSGTSSGFDVIEFRRPPVVNATGGGWDSPPPAA